VANPEADKPPSYPPVVSPPILPPDFPDIPQNPSSALQPPSHPSASANEVAGATLAAPVTKPRAVAPDVQVSQLSWTMRGQRAP
jgi:hypothetical protein